MRELRLQCANFTHFFHFRPYFAVGKRRLRPLLFLRNVCRLCVYYRLRVFDRNYGFDRRARYGRRQIDRRAGELIWRAPSRFVSD